MAKRRFDSVWDAIEATAPEAQNMKLRSELMMVLKEFILSNELSQADAAKAFGVTQPRISDLMRGKVNLFGLDSLVTMATAAGLRIDLRVRKAASLTRQVSQRGISAG